MYLSSKINKRAARQLILTISIVSLSTLLHAASVTIQGQIDTNQILIGDQVFLNMEITYPKGVSVALPQFQDTVVKGIEILENIPIDTLSEGETTAIFKKLLITSFDTGAYMLPVGPVVVNAVDTIYGQPIFLSVNTMEVDTAKGLVEIKLPYEAPITFEEVLPWLLWGGGILLVLAIIAFFVYKYMKKDKPQVEYNYVPKDPPHIIAYRELDKLKNEKLWQAGKIKLYYSRLTEILRTYIEYQFEIPALENTTDEILSAFRQSGYIGIEKLAELERLLRLADLVKFAKHDPMPEENESSHGSVYDFVRNTKTILINSPVGEQNNDASK